MKDIDWSKAPEGATHWETETDKVLASWMKLSECEWYYWPPHVAVTPEWRRATRVSQTRIDSMIARPTPPQWNGTGLPPVGVNVTLDAGEHGVFDDYRVMIGTPVKVTAAFKSPIGVDMIACALPGGLCGCFRADMARPVRTPEQIAAEDRIAAINYMEIDAGMCATAFDGDPEARVWIENLIDKGWRKTAGGAK